MRVVVSIIAGIYPACRLESIVKVYLGNAIVQLKVVKMYRYGKQYAQALRGIDPDVSYSQSVVCIVGFLDSDKTTLLNIVREWDRPNIGSVIIDGVDICRLNDAELAKFKLKRIGYVPQFFNLIPTLTVLENVELPLYLLGIKKKEREEKALKLLQLVGLIT